MIKSLECRVIFLPLYSLDLNPIEKFWANIKRWIRQQITLCQSLYQTMSAFFNIL
ncbi:transposase [Holospora curviuscula]|uniref:transposase n=1 Tax=Holospora curviuscula TaxID=1082868 RepID=UPI000CE5BC84